MIDGVWLQNLLAYSLQLLVVVLIGGALPLVIRLRNPKSELAYLHALLAVCLVLPLAQSWHAASPQGSVTVSMSAFITTAPAAAAGSGWISLVDLLQALPWFLLAGALARLMWLGLGFYRLTRYRAKSQPLPSLVSVAQEELSATTAELRVSLELKAPVTFGSRRPVVLLPERFLAFEPALQRSILCHELLHVERHDWLYTVAEEFVRAVLWFHPAVWWMVSRIHLLREQVVDREVIRRTASPDPYLRALLAMAGQRLQPDLAPASLFLRRRHLDQRVAAVIRKEIPMSRWQSISWFTVMSGVVVAAAGLASFTFPLQAVPQAAAAVSAANAVRGPEGIVVQGGEKLLYGPLIRYPKEALEKHIQGQVTLEVSVNEKGAVYDATIISGPEELRRSALQSALQWQYSKDMPLPARLPVTILFRLPENASPDLVKPPIVEPDKPLGTLANIEFRGVPDAVAGEINAVLPVRPGDTITGRLIDQTAQAVHAVYEQPALAWMGTGDEMNLIISLPAGIAAYSNREGGTQPVITEDNSAKRIRVGRAVQKERLVHQVPPFYPPLARQARIQGTVYLQVSIGGDGDVKQIEVISGHPLLIPAALEAVKQWKYRPTLLNGEPVGVETAVDIHFSLAGGPAEGPDTQASRLEQ